MSHDSWPRKLIWTSDTGLKLFSSDVCDNRLFNDIFPQNEYRDAAQELVELPHYQKPRVIVDIGAHRGYFLFYIINALKRFDQTWYIYAFEGSAQNYDECLDRLIINDIKNFKLYNCIVGRLNGSVTFVLQNPAHDCNFVIGDGKTMVMNKEAFRSDTPFTFSHLSYTDIHQYLPEGQIDLLKIDIEGSEEDFFENYQDVLKRTTLLVVEFHPNYCDVERCRNLLSEADFCQPYKMQREGVELFKRL